MGWKGEVTTASDPEEWVGNALIFATEEEALHYLQDLRWRWTAVTDIRAVPSSEPVTHS